MPPRKPSSQPTEAELEILHILWAKGSATVRDVFDAMNERKATGYTTALKLMQIMFEKGLVIRDESERTHKYAAAVTRNDTQASIVESVIDKAFGGSAHALVMSALGSGKTTDDELAKIQALIEAARRQPK